MRRRTFLGVAGTASSVALAGCGEQFDEPADEFQQDEEDGNGGDTTDESDDDREQTEGDEEETIEDEETEETEDTTEEEEQVEEEDNTDEPPEEDEATDGTEDDESLEENEDIEEEGSSGDDNDDTTDETEEADPPEDDDETGEDDPPEDEDDVADDDTTDETEEDDPPEDDDETDDTGEEDEPTPPDRSPLTLTVVGPAGEPVEGATIAGEGEPHDAEIPLEFSGETDPNGQYAAEIYENDYTIDVDHPDYHATTVSHTHDSQSELTVELERAGGGESEPDTSLLTLTVVGPDDEPIEGASVAGEGEPHEADIPLTFDGETDANGQYTDVIYENEYTIEVTHPDYEDSTVSHTHDGESELTVELEPVDDDGDDEQLVAPGESHSFVGEGTTVTEEFSLSDGIATVGFSHDGESNFIVNMLDLEGDALDDQLLVNVIGSIEGQSIVPVGDSQYQLDVNADGAWSLDLDQPGVTEDELEELPISAEGSGPDFVGPVRLEGVTEVDGTHTGESNFIVEARTAEGEFTGWDLVFNEVGEFEGTSTTRTEGVAWIDINADGDWTLGIE